MDQAEALDPRTDAPPKAGVVLVGAPNGDAALGAGEPNAAGFGVLDREGCAESVAAIPG